MKVVAVKTGVGVKPFWILQPLSGWVLVQLKTTAPVVKVVKTFEVKTVVKVSGVKFVWGALLLVSKALLNLVQLKTVVAGKTGVGVKPFWGVDGWVLVLVQWKSIGSAEKVVAGKTAVKSFWGAQPMVGWVLHFVKVLELQTVHLKRLFPRIDPFLSF